MKRRPLYPCWVPWFFLAPFLLVFGTFTVVPLFQAMGLAGVQTFGPQTSRFVGFGNFTWLFGDRLFWKAVANTALFAAGSVFIQLPLSLGLALLLNRPGLRGRNWFRLVFFSPSLFGLVAVGMLFGLIFERYTGLLNVTLNRLFGFPIDFPWLQEYVLPAMILAALWMYVGVNMIYFLAALQGVDGTLLEAASIDGAGPWQRFWHVTLPQIRPVAWFVVLLSLIGSFQLFELPYILFGATGTPAGPANRALTIVTYLYQTGFEAGDLGYASAIGWGLAFILVGFAMLQRAVGRRDES